MCVCVCVCVCVNGKWINKIPTVLYPHTTLNANATMHNYHEKRYIVYTHTYMEMWGILSHYTSPLSLSLSLSLSHTHTHTHTHTPFLSFSLSPTLLYTCISFHPPLPTLFPLFHFLSPSPSPLSFSA